MKKNYLKPKMEIVKVQLSECIAGSNDVLVDPGKVTHSETIGEWTIAGSSAN